MHAGRRRRSPGDPLGDGIENGEMLRAVGQELAPEFERILACRVGALVDERLQPDRILVGVEAAPDAHRHMRVAYGVLDQEIGNGVTKTALRNNWIKTLKGIRIPPMLVNGIRSGAR